MLREFVKLPGGPCVPRELSPRKERVQPATSWRRRVLRREEDGNLTCQKDPESVVVEIGWEGKFRGAEFSPLSLSVLTKTCDGLKDAKGRNMRSVVAEPLAGAEVGALEQHCGRKRGQAPRPHAQPAGAFAEKMAEALGWLTPAGGTRKGYVDRQLNKLANHRLVEKKDHTREMVATEPRGKTAAEKAKAEERVL